MRHLLQGPCDGQRRTKNALSVTVIASGTSPNLLFCDACYLESFGRPVCLGGAKSTERRRAGSNSDQLAAAAAPSARPPSRRPSSATVHRK